MPKNLLETNFQEPYKAWTQDPSLANTGQLLRAVDPVLNIAVRAYAGPSAQSVTIKSQAKKMAAEAFRSYDPAKGPLKSHLMSRLQRLRRTASRHRQIIRVPEQVALDQMQSERAAIELEEQIGHPPSDQELADFTGLSLKRLAYIRGGRRPLAEGTITRPGDEGSGSYDPRVRPLQESHDVWLELVYDDLDTTDQYILERLRGLHGHPKMKSSQVAAQLKMSSGAVSLRVARIQKKIDQRDALGML